MDEILLCMGRRVIGLSASQCQQKYRTLPSADSQLSLCKERRGQAGRQDVLRDSAAWEGLWGGGHQGYRPRGAGHS